MIKGNSPSVLVLNSSGASPLFHCFTRCATRYLNSPPSARSTEGGWAELGIRIPRSIDSPPLPAWSVVSFSTLADRTRNRRLAGRQPASQYRDIRAFCPAGHLDVGAPAATWRNSGSG